MEEEKDTVVVARSGYQVLLNVGPQNLDIDCYEPVNLSHMFSEEQLGNCASLKAHLEDGNLIYYTGQPLPKNPHAVVIKPLVEASTTKIEAEFTQETQTPAAHVQVKTDVKIDEDLKKDIQDRVSASRKEILESDKKILNSHKKKEAVAIDVGAQQPRVAPMTSDKLQMAVHMDVDPVEFKRRQKAAHKQLQDKDEADEARALAEIVAAEANQDD